jgi:hypothetical protein
VHLLLPVLPPSASVLAAKTNFPIQDYLGGGTIGGSRDNSAAAAAESPRAPGGIKGGADALGRRRSSCAGDASAKGGQAQQSDLSWGALGMSRSARLSHDASEGAPRYVDGIWAVGLPGRLLWFAWEAMSSGWPGRTVRP